jgi:hypothetical protein
MHVALTPSRRLLTVWQLTLKDEVHVRKLTPKSYTLISFLSDPIMEDDRAQVDLGIAADIEEAHAAAEPVQKQPKKRFVGRRTADATARNAGNTSIEDSGAIQGTIQLITHLATCF